MLSRQVAATACRPFFHIALPVKTVSRSCVKSVKFSHLLQGHRRLKSGISIGNKIAPPGKYSTAQHERETPRKTIPAVAHLRERR
jgi:hypothetical protein